MSEACCRARVWEKFPACPSSRTRTSSSWPALAPLAPAPLSHALVDLRWRLFQGNSRTLIGNQPGLIDDTKLAPTSRSGAGGQVRGGFRGLLPGKTCGHVPEPSETDTSCVVHLEMDGEASGMSNLLRAGQINLRVWNFSRVSTPLFPARALMGGWVMQWAGPERQRLSAAGKLSLISCGLQDSSRPRHLWWIRFTTPLHVSISCRQECMSPRKL